MPMKRQILFWLGTFVFLLGIIFLLGSTLTPFAAGMVLAYLLDPLVTKLRSLGISRLIATILIMLVFVIIFILFLVIFVPLIAHQMGNFLIALPAYVAKIQTLVLDSIEPIMDHWYENEPRPDLRGSVNDLVRQAATWFGAFLKSLWSSGQALISMLSLIIVTPIVAFYLLVDWQEMITRIDSWLPRRYQHIIRQLCREIDKAIAGCIRGQTSVCLILGSYYAIGLSVIGLNFGALIGMIAGILSFIPYVGSSIGLLLAMGVAFSQFWPEWTMIIVTALVFGSGQFLEGNFLSPKIVGQSAGLHPVWLMFALLAFGSLLGFVGLLIALPLAAATGVLVRFALTQYLASPFYSDNTDEYPEIAETKPASSGSDPAVSRISVPPVEVQDAG